MPGNSMAEAERWAAEIPAPAYAIDDETAIKVVDGTVEVVSEGTEAVHPQSGSKRIGLMRHAAHPTHRLRKQPGWSMPLFGG
jgi:hypothetical protein